MEGDSSFQERVACFTKVQSLIYHIATQGEPDCCCSTKARLLSRELTQLSLASRVATCWFKWERLGLPQSVLEIPHEDLPCHDFLEVYVPEVQRWVRVDPTWDPALGAALPIATWDGKSDTICAVPIERLCTADEAQEIERACADPALTKSYFESQGPFLRAVNSFLVGVRMASRNKIATVVLVLGFSIAWMLTTVSLGVAEDSSRASEIRIGAIASLTGDAARDGLNWLEGAKLAAEELQSRGKNVRLIVEDDGTNPAKGAAAFGKLVAADKVGGIVGGTWDFLAEASYPLAKQNKIPFLTPTNPVEILSDAAKVNPWIFTNGLSLAAESKVIELFLRKRKARTISLIYVNVPYGTIHGELLRGISKKIGVQVVSDNLLEYQSYNQMLRMAVMKVAEVKPDVVFIVTGYDGADMLLRELERSHVSTTVLMTHCLKAAYDFGGAPNRYKEAFGIFSRLMMSSFEQSFLKKYGREPYDYAPIGYDAVRFMAQLLEESAGRDLATVHVSYAGVTGLHELPSATRSVAATQAAVMQMVDGKLVEYVTEEEARNGTQGK